MIFDVFLCLKLVLVVLSDVLVCHTNRLLYLHVLKMLSGIMGIFILCWAPLLCKSSICFFVSENVLIFYDAVFRWHFAVQQVKDCL